jgi:hypothetical protein
MMAPPFDCHVAASGAATEQGALAFEQPSGARTRMPRVP